MESPCPRSPCSEDKNSRLCLLPPRGWPHRGAVHVTTPRLPSPSSRRARPSSRAPGKGLPARRLTASPPGGATGQARVPRRVAANKGSRTLATMHQGAAPLKLCWTSPSSQRGSPTLQRDGPSASSSRRSRAPPAHPGRRGPLRRPTERFAACVIAGGEPPPNQVAQRAVTSDGARPQNARAY